MIILYDIKANIPEKSWLLFSLRVRYVLNYKGIEHKTEFIEYPEVERVSKELGANPTTVKLDGSPFWTFPTIKDLSNGGKVVTDSLKIVQYLDETYPDTPRVIIPGTIGLLKVLESTYIPTVGWTAIKHQISCRLETLTPSSRDYYRDFREKFFNMKLEDMMCKGEEFDKMVTEVEAGFAKMGLWYEEESSVMLGGGDTPTYADFIMAANIRSILIVWGRESDAGKKMMSWQGGRWKRLLDSLEKYQTVY